MPERIPRTPRPLDPIHRREPDHDDPAFDPYEDTDEIVDEEDDIVDKRDRNGQ